MSEKGGLGGLALLEEVHHMGWALKFQKPTPGLVCVYLCTCLSVSLSLCLLPVNQDVKLPVTALASCFPAHCHTTHHENSGLTL